MSIQETREEFLDAVDKGIAKHGVFVLGILGDESGLGWMYTVGMTDKRLPEIIVSGFSKHFHATINLVALGAYKHGAPLELGEIKETLLTLKDGTPLRMALREVDNPRFVGKDRACQADERYNGISKYLQLVWGDGNNILPEELGYDFVNFPQELY